MVFTTATDQLDCVHLTGFDEFKTSCLEIDIVSLFGHADIVLSHKIVTYSDGVCYLLHLPLNSYWGGGFTSFIDYLEYLLRFWFSYRNTTANPLKQIFDTEGGREML